MRNFTRVEKSKLKDAQRPGLQTIQVGKQLKKTPDPHSEKEGEGGRERGRERDHLGMKGPKPFPLIYQFLRLDLKTGRSKKEKMWIRPGF